MARQLEGPVVTGSSSGNGRETALALAREGAARVCSDIRKSVLAGGYEPDFDMETEAAINHPGGKAIFIAADTSKSADLQQLVAGAVEAFGRLDIMVNSAGVFTEMQTIVDETEEQYDYTTNVNTKGVWFGCKYAMTRFREQAILEMPGGGQVRGRVVNIASLGGLVGLVLEPVYCTSQGYVGQFNPRMGMAEECCPRHHISCF